MLGTTSWVVYIAAGILFLGLMRATTNSLLDAIFVRLGALSFLAAGFAGSVGWFATLVSGGVDLVTDLVNTFSTAAVGGVLMPIIWITLGICWFVCMIPERWMKYHIPDWLSISGIVLPAGLATVPGPFGDQMAKFMETLSHIVTIPLQSILGG